MIVKSLTLLASAIATDPAQNQPDPRDFDVNEEDQEDIAAAERDSIRLQNARSGTGGRGGVELVAQSVDPTTGHVDTFRIALWVSDAAKLDFKAAAQAYATIETQLLARSPGDLARFNQDLVKALGKSPAAVGGPEALRPAGIHPTSEPPSATAGLRSLLERHGIEVPKS